MGCGVRRGVVRHTRRRVRRSRRQGFRGGATATTHTQRRKRVRQIKRGKTLVRKAKAYFEDGGGWGRGSLAGADGSCCLIGGLMVAGGIPVGQLTDRGAPLPEEERRLEGADEEAISVVQQAIVEESPRSRDGKNLRELLGDEPPYDRWSGRQLSEHERRVKLRNHVMSWNDCSTHYIRVRNVLDHAMASGTHT